MSDAATIQKMIADEEVQYVDLRFTDPRGKMQHLTLDISLIDMTSLPKAPCSMVHPSQVGRRLTSQTWY